ncbi:MAG: hypothetical protein GY754_04725 [bacterium]|nr:hypothetical protein [bacterium]
MPIKLNAAYTENDFINFAQCIAWKVHFSYKKFYERKLLRVIEYVNRTNEDPKQEHQVDRVIKKIINETIETEFPDLLARANIYMEDLKIKKAVHPTCSIFIDPVDGSRCADLHIGDPCFMAAYSPETQNITFRNLTACFIMGFHSGDIYFSFNNKAYYVPGGHSFTLEGSSVIINNTIKLKALQLPAQSPQRIKDTTIIVHDGYGMRKTVALKLDYAVLNEARHIFSHDITGIELCYLAACRDIVHILFEGRDHWKGKKQVGSDGFNLIPFPLVKAVGGSIYDLKGELLDDQEYDPGGVYDFIAVTNKKLAREFIKKGVKNPRPV